MRTQSFLTSEIESVVAVFTLRMPCNFYQRLSSNPSKRWMICVISTIIKCCGDGHGTDGDNNGGDVDDDDDDDDDDDNDDDDDDGDNDDAVYNYDGVMSMVVMKIMMVMIMVMMIAMMMTLMMIKIMLMRMMML
ncbi:hypothetical protein ElyMa_005511000 [Elysia marginata]|uniref:Uncharacterized protein n=1 Tax=Elysia marginata TaxID=1093978 RepID=A0AAV4EWS9_9GAST|nr:hypothetical protein ElyMa_005511000 [Elysia marginata]